VEAKQRKRTGQFVGRFCQLRISQPLRCHEANGQPSAMTSPGRPFSKAIRQTYLTWGLLGGFIISGGTGCQERTHQGNSAANSSSPRETSSGVDRPSGDQQPLTSDVANPANPPRPRLIESANQQRTGKSTATGETTTKPRFRLSRKGTGEAASPETAIRFTDVTASTGVAFTYYGGPSPERYMTEQNGGGVGMIDFDADGQLDLFFPNGSSFQRTAEQAGARHHLYRSLGKWQYQEVAAAAGLDQFGFGMGCAVGDFDNDGFADLFLAQYGQNRLWRNNGDGTFAEVTHALLGTSSTSIPRWGTSTAFADFDGDGNLDLYVVNYVDWAASDPPCFTQHAKPIRISCGPIGRTGQPDRLYHNRGDGTFLEISQSAGIVQPEAKGLGLVVADFNGDQRLDVYVANDTTENDYFVNEGDLRFTEEGVAQGVAVGSDGLAHSGMGIACGDVNGDGFFDLFVTNFDNEVNDLYQNLNGQGFSCINTLYSLDASSRPMLGFGTLFGDWDADGDLDLFVANGHVWDLTSMGLSYRYEMLPQLLQNQQNARFEDVSSAAGPYFQQPVLGRGVAAGDLDRDGDDDLVITHLSRPATILRNDSRQAVRMLPVRIIGRTAARQPLGCRIDIKLGANKRAYWITAGGSFQSASDAQVLMHVGAAEQIDELHVHWPSDSIESWYQLPIPAVGPLTLQQGTGKSPPQN
jgi:hypothetical protein